MLDDSPKVGKRHPRPELLGPGASCIIQGGVHLSMMQIGRWRMGPTWTLAREKCLSQASNRWSPSCAVTPSLLRHSTCQGGVLRE